MVVSHNNMIPSVKLEKRKTFKETVVKCSLRSILLGENVQKDAIVKAIGAANATRPFHWTR